jgi:hypothetical protein
LTLLRDVGSTGRNALPTAYSPAAGSVKEATARRNSSGTCVMMPAPSPVPASEPTAPRCSRCRSASSAAVMMSCPAVPRRVATIARPQASFSAAGSYMPWASGTRPNLEKGGVSDTWTVLIN